MGWRRDVHTSGPLRIADIARSKGKRRRGHKGHKPANVLSGIPRSEKVAHMQKSLVASGWSFRFKVQAASSMGFNYEAEGDTAEEAFLKAFGLWRNDLASFLPKVPQILEKARETPAVVPAQKPQPKLKELLLRYGEKLIAKKPLIQDQGEWKRLYMRAYRNRQRLVKGEPLVAA